jgi:hypothetical protein
MRQWLGTEEDAKCGATSRPKMRRMRVALLFGLGLGLTACANDPTFRGAEPIGDPKLARAHLQVMAEAGPVPAEMRQLPDTLTPDETAANAARGVPFQKVIFTPVLVPPARIEGARLVLWFNGPRVAADVCAGRATIQPIPRRRPELSAAWCEGTTAVAGLVGEAADQSRNSMQRLIWQTTARLFPDTYIDNTGFDMWGLNVRPGGSVGF